MGWIKPDGTGGGVDSYRLTSYAMDGVTPGNQRLPLRDASVERPGGNAAGSGGNGGETLVVRFVAAIKDIGPSRFAAVVAEGTGGRAFFSPTHFHDSDIQAAAAAFKPQIVYFLLSSNAIHILKHALYLV